jgi:hypothetical protein
MPERKQLRPVIVKPDKNKDEYLILGTPPFSLSELREIYGAIESVIKGRAMPLHIPKIDQSKNS